MQDFEDARDAEDAVYELNGRDLMGNRVVVEECRPRKFLGPPRGGFSGGGSRGGGFADRAPKW